MRLADFIDTNIPAILAEWDLFASSLLPAAGLLDAAALRDHSEQMLHAITKDLRSTQSAAEQSAKSKGLAPVLINAMETAAQSHALQRATVGFSIRQLVAEYRALRASVLRLWGDAGTYGPEAIEDIGRFNEAVDQAIAESVDFYTKEMERWRALLLGMLGHDLRGPLNTILITSRLITSLSADRTVNVHTEKLVRSGERMQALLDDLLDYNRTSLDIGIRVSPQRVDLASVISEEIELLRTLLPTSAIDLTLVGEVSGSWDASRLKQVISNLVTNAAKYGDQARPIGVKLVGYETHVSLSVENAGPNIPKELIASLFEPLRRHAVADSESERVSLGLGLFIVQQIALSHGGDVSVESLDGRTRFIVTLPKEIASAEAN